MSDNTSLKSAAAESAAALVTDGMIVGLGSGSTAALAVSAIGRRVRQGLRIVGVPTSESTAAQARDLGIPLTTDLSDIALTIDGADEVEDGTLDLIKGHGGALLREKIVANASRRLIIVIDQSKRVGRLGERFAVPVEVVPFGWQTTALALSKLGAVPALRNNSSGAPFVSDGGHYILDCRFQGTIPAQELAQQLDHVVGLVEHGLFIAMTSEVHVGAPAGVQVLRRP
jgi:ribose 5-phosphate isomerase A